MSLVGLSSTSVSHAEWRWVTIEDVAYRLNETVDDARAARSRRSPDGSPNPSLVPG
jgi:hypothetical protein